MKNWVTDIKPQTIFLIIGLIYGLGFLLANPPLLGVDNEGEHYDKALYLSDGYVIPEIFDHHAGYYVPQGAYNLEVKFYTLRNMHKKIGVDDILSSLNQPLNESNKVFTDVDRTPPIPSTAVSFSAIITYSPLPYLASAFAMTIGKILSFSPIILMYIGRLANLIVWLTFIYLAIRITPVHKWVLLMLSLMPMTILAGSSLSADSFAIALSFLVIAIFLNFAFNNNIKNIETKEIGILFILMIMLALSKQTYLFLIFLFFIIPTNKFVNRNRMFIIFIILFLSTFLISIYWNMDVNRFYLPTFLHVSIPLQTSFIESNPLNFINIIINTILTKNIVLSIITSFIGDFRGYTIYLPNWLITFYFILYPSMLTLTALLDKSDIIVDIKQKLIILITFITVFVLICISMYLTGTPVGQNTINNIVGRYFIPIAPLLFLVLYNNKIKFNIGKGYNLIIISVIIFSLTIALYLLVTGNFNL
ncbi:MAG: DUF2142 domain-containing protein [Methanobacterium sp.]|uniref:DUF2142 domain-containing protein n=1 Tax=Methanobacterium sp. TaxID=2164 RepID=UPI003C781135